MLVIALASISNRLTKMVSYSYLRVSVPIMNQALLMSNSMMRMNCLLLTKDVTLMVLQVRHKIKTASLEVNIDLGQEIYDILHIVVKSLAF